MAPWIACFVLAFIPLGEAVRPKWTDALDKEPNDDRAQCLRQDNLDIAGGETNQKYILRQVYSPDHANPQTDIYFLCEDFILRRIHAQLTIQRVERNEFEFTLAGPSYDKFRAAGEISQYKPDVGTASFVMKGFEVVTGMKIAEWAADLAANREVLREGQEGSMSFTLSGRVRAVQKRGVWEAELVTGSEKVSHFDFKIHRQWVIDKILRSWGKLKQLLIQQLYELIKAAIPINLLAALKYLPFQPGLPQQEQDLSVQVKMKLWGGTKDSGPLSLSSRLWFDMFFKPAALLEVLMKKFNVKEMARHAVVRFFEDPETKEAFHENRDAFLQNLHQYRFVLSDSLLRLVKESKQLDDLFPLLLKEAEERATDLLLKVLDPLVKAHASGASGNFKNLQVGFYFNGGWDADTNGLFEAKIRPLKSLDGTTTVFMDMNRSLLDFFGLRESLLEPLHQDQSCQSKVTGLSFDTGALRFDSGMIQNCRRSLDNKSAISWQVREAEFSNAVLRVPPVLSFDTAVSLAHLEVNFTPDGRVLLTSEGDSITITQRKTFTKAKVWNKLRRNDSSRWDGLVPHAYQKPEKEDPDANVGILDRIHDAWLNGIVSIKGIDENQVLVSTAADSKMKLHLSPLLQRLLAPEQRQDFGYIFEADLFKHFEGRNRWSKLKMAVLHCGFLRLFDWPLQDHGSQTLGTNHLIDIDLVSVLKEGSSTLTPAVPGEDFCVEVTFKPQQSNGWFWQKPEVISKHRLCGAQEKVKRMAIAIGLQKLRFRDKEAEEENYGSHHAGKDAFLLKHGKVQRNLVEVMKERAKAALPGWVELNSTVLDANDAVDASASMVAVPLSDDTGLELTRPSSVLSEDLNEAKVVPAIPGSDQSQKCRAEDLLNRLWPPERYGKAVLRKAFPTKALGNVYVLVQNLQLVSLDLRGTLMRSSDTTFSLMLAGPEGGQAEVQMYVEGIDFSAPGSTLPGMVRAASAVDSMFRPFGFSEKRSPFRSLQRGPLLVKFRMKVEFQMKKGHWEVKPGALSDVDIKFGNGGAVENSINTLLDIFGKVDELLLESLWPVVANYFPENFIEALEKVSRHDGQAAHHFKLMARCHQRMGERCRSDKVDFFIKMLTNLDVATSVVFPRYLMNLSPKLDEIEESLALTLLSSYVSCLSHERSQPGGSSGPLEDMLGSAILSLDMDEGKRVQVNASTEARVPVKMLRCFLGDQVLNGLLPKETRSLIKGAGTLYQQELHISEVHLQSLRLPLRMRGSEDAIELSVTMNKAIVILNDPQGTAEKVLGHFNLELDPDKGLLLRKITDGYPLLSMDLSRNFLQSFFQKVGDQWKRPRNVRTAPEYRPDGVIPDKYRRPRDQPAPGLDFQQLLVKADGRLGLHFSDRAPAKPEPGKTTQEHVQAQMSLVLSATFDMNQNFWRGVLNRRQVDYGFVYGLVVGTWGLQNGRKIPAVLQMSCDQIQVFRLQGTQPFEMELFSKDIHDIFMELVTHTPDFQHVGDKTCLTLTLVWNSWLKNPDTQFCGSVKDMEWLKEGLLLQMKRLGHVTAAKVHAEAADAESTKRTGVRFTGEHKILGDSTWFRRYNAFDTTSWTPEIPTEYQTADRKSVV